MIFNKKVGWRFKQFKDNKPFNYCVIDDFFDINHAKQLGSEIPDFDSTQWYEYKNKIEIKKASNNWNIFPKTTYETFNYLNSNAFLDLLKGLTGINDLFPDQGLNGGGGIFMPMAEN